MSKIEQLDKLDRAIKDAEIRLKSILLNVEQLGKEIAVLEPRQEELQTNIAFQKQQNTVPLAHEYGKAKRELSKTKARLILIKSEHKKADQASKDVQKIIEKFKKDHADLIKVSENNILKVVFGGNRGKK